MFKLACLIVIYLLFPNYLFAGFVYVKLLAALFFCILYIRVECLSLSNRWFDGFTKLCLSYSALAYLPPLFDFNSYLINEAFIQPLTLVLYALFPVFLLNKNLLRRPNDVVLLNSFSLKGLSTSFGYSKAVFFLFYALALLVFLFQLLPSNILSLYQADFVGRARYVAPFTHPYGLTFSILCLTFSLLITRSVRIVYLRLSLTFMEVMQLLVVIGISSLILILSQSKTSILYLLFILVCFLHLIFCAVFLSSKKFKSVVLSFIVVISFLFLPPFVLSSSVFSVFSASFFFLDDQSISRSIAYSQASSVDTLSLGDYLSNMFNALLYSGSTQNRLEELSIFNTANAFNIVAGHGFGYIKVANLDETLPSYLLFTFGALGFLLFLLFIAWFFSFVFYIPLRYISFTILFLFFMVLTFLASPAIFSPSTFLLYIFSWLVILDSLSFLRLKSA